MLIGTLAYCSLLELIGACCFFACVAQRSFVLVGRIAYQMLSLHALPPSRAPPWRLSTRPFLLLLVGSPRAVVRRAEYCDLYIAWLFGSACAVTVTVHCSFFGLACAFISYSPSLVNLHNLQSSFGSCILEFLALVYREASSDEKCFCCDCTLQLFGLACAFTRLPS